MRKWLALCALLLMPVVAFGQVAGEETAIEKIRKEGTGNSQVMKTLQVLTDRYGPRLTGSPNHEAAAAWAVKQLGEWGLKNGHLEAWDFGREGWTNERAEGHLVLPGVKVPLHFGVSAWTPSTAGEVTGEVVQMVMPAGNAQVVAEWMAANREKVKGKIVMMGKATPPAPAAAAGGRRGGGPATAPATRGAGGRGGGGRGGGATGLPQADEMINAWLLGGGAVARVDSGAGANGMLRSIHNRTLDVSKAVPGVILRNEDFGRIERLLESDELVKLSFNIQNKSHPAGKTSHNVIAEIVGSEKPDEIVMLGAHLDSWHLATGATDNAAACSMMMEAVRIIQVSGLKPRRTIRIGLWSGEEQGLLGSKAYVREHFGTFENPKPEFAKIICYYNVDSGAGSVRSLMVFGPPEAQSVLRDSIVPFADLGASGATAFLSRAFGSTDSSSFSNAGISTVDGMQSSTDYSLTHHTSFDTFDRVVADDVVRGSIVLAGSVWEVANRTEKLPLFTKETMPRPAGN